MARFRDEVLVSALGEGLSVLEDDLLVPVSALEDDLLVPVSALEDDLLVPPVVPRDREGPRIEEVAGDRPRIAEVGAVILDRDLARG